uniref:uncharacterized protein LOC120333921 isoform X2 n=1 Tax=Styela clava TaxID=7725 RepID=UPI0019397341|nr:uncharacterized protein LOC120333921 isoform X2 [Styela clava]
MSNLFFQIRDFVHCTLAVLFIAVFPSIHGFCNVTNLNLTNQTGFIRSPPPVESQSQDCTWNFSPSGSAIVLLIKDMNFILNYRQQYWWYSAQLTLEGHNINDFKKGACFIFLPDDDVTCDTLEITTSDCDSKLLFSGNTTFPPTLSYKTLHLYYKKEHAFEMKYTYVPCKKNMKPVSNTKVDRGAIMSFQDSKKEIHKREEETKIDPVVIALGILCGVLAVAVFFLAWRLCTTKKEKKKSHARENDRAQILL